MISKKIRQVVYNKYHGHCAYCGKEIAYKEMQVDHLVPLQRNYSNELINDWRSKGYNVSPKGTDDVSNLMPSCRMCNFRKGMGSLEHFREELRQQAIREMQRFQARQSVDYGLIEHHDHPIVFYFETQKA